MANVQGRLGTSMRGAPLLLWLIVAACSTTTQREFPAISDPPTVTPGQRASVVATTTQIADFVRVVGGDHVMLVELIKPGTDPHEYEPTPQDVQRVTQANLIVINGVGLEAFIGKLLQQAGESIPVAVLADGVKIRTAAGDRSNKGDPHIWYDPRNVKLMVANLATALGKVDPANAAAYRANADAYTLQLDDLDRRIQEQINSIPKERRKMVTNHDSFGYYIARYGLTFVGSALPSLETNAAPSAKQTADLIRTIQRERVPAIFTDAALDPKLEEQIARDAGITVIAQLCADSLTPPGTACATYLTMMEHDTRVIVEALR